MILPSARAPAAPDKIQGHHLDRLAVVYVRQSTLQQIERHQESTRLQYGLVDRALQLGWARERILTIDDDLGRSAASAEGRPGFQRLVADVGLGRVGLVLGVEMSRLARSCRDWHQLLEICALRDTLIADSDGIYDPATYNDRLLLGLKGTLSEAELHLLKTRMHEGRRAKAERGELFFNLPRGYVRRPSGEVALDPDEQVQATIRLVFSIFERRGSLNGVLSYLVAHDVQLPYRIRSGPAKGELEWHRPNRYTLAEMLDNPAYAGAYAYGRRLLDRAHQQPGRPATGRRLAILGQGGVLLKNRWPAYISWQTYERNVAQVVANRSQHTGVPRGGPGLLAGLLVCGRCGQRMVTQYPGGGRFLRYSCSRRTINYGEARCQSLSGRALDALVADLMLQALAPSALEVSLQTAEDLELERTELHRQWRQRLERARYEVDRARRQYDAVEPENRLVARTLERQWEAALAAEQRLMADSEQFRSRQPIPLTVAERQRIARLAEDVPALWNAPTTTATDRQAIARLMLERVVVTVEGDREKVAVECHWVGGVQTSHSLRRPVARLGQLSDHAALLDRVRDLHACGLKAPAIAAALNAEGWRPAKRRPTFTAEMVRSLLHRQGVPVNPRLSWAARIDRREPDEFTIGELATQLAMPTATLHRWVARGIVSARKVTVLTHALWLIKADARELERLRQQRDRHHRTYPSPQTALETHHAW
jgi:DNA invertase Pin-like site-specific DNA recombinase